jgi:prepilin peptidase CpaA
MFDFAGVDVSTGLLLALVATAAVTDLRWRKIYNGLTYPGTLAALALNAVGSVLEYTGYVAPRAQRVFGWIGRWESCLGLLACGLCLLVCYIFFRVGGGDLKLMAMIGAFLGPYEGIEVLLWTFVLGAALGLLLLIWRLGAAQLLVAGLRRLRTALRLRDWSLLIGEAGGDTRTSLFLAPSAAVAVVVVHFQLLGTFRLL